MLIERSETKDNLAESRRHGRSDPECSVEEAKELLRGDTGTILIDMRSEGVCRVGHIKGARFIPADRIEAELRGLPGSERPGSSSTALSASALSPSPRS